MDSWMKSSTTIQRQQGIMFNKQRQKQNDNALTNSKKYLNFVSDSGLKEGFSDKTQSKIAALQELEKLKATYDGLIQQQQANRTAVSEKTDVYITYGNSENIYANKNVLLKNAGALGYVTSNGVYKWYSSWDLVDATAGKNGCPVLRSGIASDYMTLDEPVGASYTVVGTVLSRNPRIIVGEPMVSGQSCGNENTNVYVSGAIPPTTTYSGCYKDSSNRTMTYQTDGYIFDYESCKQRAIDTSSQYFAIQDYQPSWKAGQCFVGNDYDKAISLGTADTYPNTNLWNSTHVATKNCYGVLKNDGNLYTYDSNGKELSNTGTWTTECAPVLPTNISATWGGNIDGIEEGNATSALQKYNNGSQTFSYYVGNQMSDPARGKDKSFDLTYKCGDKIKSQYVEKANRLTVTLDCSDAPLPCSTYLILKDDGQMAIYKGISPGLNDQLIYAWPKYDVSKSTPNPFYPQTTSKTGTNWISSNVRLNPLANYEYVSSDDGKLLFYVFSDGNMYLSTYTLVEGCPKQSDGHAYGGGWANALYSFDSAPNSAENGKIGYVDDSGVLREYSANAVEYTNKYKKYAGYASGNGIKEYKNSDPFACKIACSTDDTCAGYVFYNDTKTCYTNRNVYPKSAKTPDKNADLYVRELKVNNSNSCNKEIVDIDSNMWKGYTKGDPMGPDEVCGLGKVLEDPYDKIEETQKQIDDVVKQMKDLFTRLQQDNVKLTADMLQLQIKIGQDFSEYNSVKEDIEQKQTAQTTINSMLSDSHLVVLQENYKYTFLSVIAIGALIVAMNVAKNVPR